MAREMSHYRDRVHVLSKGRDDNDRSNLALQTAGGVAQWDASNRGFGDISSHLA